MKKTGKIISFLLILTFLMTGFPSDLKLFAADDDELALEVMYNQSSYTYDVSFTPAIQPARVVLRFHTNEYDSVAMQYREEIIELIAPELQNGKVVAHINDDLIMSNHIYDISVEVYRRIDDTVPYQKGLVYYLAGMTFTGESFNVMAKNSDIEDADPDRIKDDKNNAILVKSGYEPVIRLSWTVPTIIVSGSLKKLTDPEVLAALSEENIPISRASFQINMTVGKDSDRKLNYYAEYDQEDGKFKIKVGDQETEVVFDAEKNTMTVTLTAEHGIEPGTEYAFTNIGVIFRDSSSAPITLRSTKLVANRDNRFPVRNRDKVFERISPNSSSIFTPIPFEITKIDTDKVEVRFRKIVNGIYPVLYYQVQDADRLDDLFSTEKSWVKIPESSLTYDDFYGYHIVNVNVTGNTNPEWYFRVVVYDSETERPMTSSLAVNLQELAVDAGRPPMPKEIKVTPIYGGRTKVTVPSTDLSTGEFNIPITHLELSFEKPISWKKYHNDRINDDYGWDEFRSSPHDDSDYVFHIILSATLPESGVEKDTKVIKGLSDNSNEVSKEVYLPVKQKRVLVLSKKQFIQDPADPNRIITQIPIGNTTNTIPGDKLFYDYATNTDLTDRENNEDPSEDGKPGDYPEFLIPNTTYYMQMFTSRYGDLAAINNEAWGDSDGLGGLEDSISYLSPVISFTTWPLKEAVVPVPDIGYRLYTGIEEDPDTGKTILSIISEFPPILTNADWKRYTDLSEKRMVKYEFFISKYPANFDSTVDAAYLDIYTDQADKSNITVTIRELINGSEREPILPNTVYYVKARASLWVIHGESDLENPDDPVPDQQLGSSIETAVKSITTPKIDTGGWDNVDRYPQAPTSFAIAQDENMEDLVGDIWVDLTWDHNERDVFYEMVCTTDPILPDAAEDDYMGDDINKRFLSIYGSRGITVENSSLRLDVMDTDIISKANLEITGKKVVMHVRSSPTEPSFLQPNRIYYFSLRAVRKETAPDGSEKVTFSRWITVPVTTKMVQPPALLEAVKDMEIGFNLVCNVSGITADAMEVYIRKKNSADTSFTKLNRGEFTCVKDGTVFYFRIYNLEPDQWYEVRVKNTKSNTWYDAISKTWITTEGAPIQEKTRNPYYEIEVRFEGELSYTYILEARPEDDNKYSELIYSGAGSTDYGYDTPSGRIDYYKEKVSGEPGKYMYYARIRAINYKPLKSNTLYYVRLYKRIWITDENGNRINADSLSIGPVTARTDFSQADYDKDKTRDNIIDLFNDTADRLTQKLYWRIDINSGTNVRVLLKGDRIAGLLQAGKKSTVTVDISSEHADASYYEILIPYKTLEAIEKYNSRLNIKLLGSEITLNRGTVDLALLKQQGLAGAAKEAMLILKVSRRISPVKALTGDLKAASRSYELQAVAGGSRMTYAEIDKAIYDILKNPDAKGPFKYGILDRELTNVLNRLASYSYSSHLELKDLIVSVIDKVEVELSRYLKDIIDGGSGLPANFAVTKSISEFPGKLGVKLEYTLQNGYIAPYVNYGTGWREPAGGKGYVMQYVLFRVEKPGEYIVAVRGQAAVQPGGTDSSALAYLSSRYDLTKVFGKGTIYLANPIKGEQAVMLYAVVTERDAEIIGLTPMQKVTALDLGGIIGASELTGYLDNQTSVSLAVKLYCAKMNIDPKYMKPSRTITIENSSDIKTRLYPFVVLGVDLNIVELSNRRFNATGRTTIGNMLDMVARILEGL